MLKLELAQVALLLERLSFIEGAFTENVSLMNDDMDSRYKLDVSGLKSEEIDAARERFADEREEQRHDRYLSYGKKLFVSLRAHCENVNAPLTAVAIDRALATQEPLNLHVIADVKQRLHDELKNSYFFTLEPKEFRMFNGDDFPPGIVAKFPSAAYDIDEALKCLALGRSTASVFHLMRVSELSLRAVHHCLAITVPLTGNDRNWGNIVGRIRDNIKARGATFSERDLFQEIYARLDAVKDSWRNGTMHVESKYTSEEAESVLLAVRAFLSKVSSRMDENGLPLA